MPKSFQNKPGFYDDADSTVANNNKIGSDKKAVDLKQSNGAQKKPTPNGTNDKRWV